ncbi:LysR family transcriptional regulator substrate-binding protein [uncultured Lactobacillus sp.]|uniref:LysR family transcriptional regulator substrate-binding protein n=1 Tax=uncultured Lactobacillus sp. TaxID=153152 RepID=UPI0028044D49|nr:LysR family transcriptional regulator substrate-binding protein [uncultured Lactobacillus sp.]
MEQLKVAYFNQLGRKELDQAKSEFEQDTGVNVKLIGAGYDEAFEKLADHEVDLVIADKRDEDHDFKQEDLVQVGVMAILPKGSYQSGIQMVDKSNLTDLTCFIVAKPEEEAAELHLYKDLYQIKSPFIASNSVEEAALLVASGSGYFLINEIAANLIKNDSLQRLFLMDNDKMMRQTISAFYNEDNPFIEKFIEILKKEY